MRILFLGESYRADAQTWYLGIQNASGLPVEIKELPSTGGRFSRMIKAVKFLIGLVFSSEKYDMVLAERSTSYGFFSLFVKTKIRVVAQQGITDCWPDKGFAGWYKRLLQRAIYQRADRIHAWGYVMTYSMLERGTPPSRIRVKPKGLDLNRYTFAEHSPEEQVTAIVTRSLFDIYRHEDILEGIYLLKQKGITIRCLMVGDGAERDKLHALSQKLGLSQQIDWLGRIPNPELPALLRKASLYLAVPTTEGVSSSLFEAMACGCFPIVTDLPANRAFIANGVNGLLVEVCNHAHLAYQIEVYLENRNLFRKGILENRNFIDKNCNVEKNMKEFFEDYVQLANSK